MDASPRFTPTLNGFSVAISTVPEAPPTFALLALALALLSPLVRRRRD